MTRESRDGTSGSPTGVEQSGEASLDAVASAVGEGVFRLDAEGRFEAANDVLCDLAGYDRSDLLGEGLSLLFSGADAEAVEAAIRESAEGDGRVGDVQATLLTADDGRVPCELRLAPLGPPGDGGGTAGVLRDVTEEKRPESILAQYETVVEAVDDGLYAVDEDYRFTLVNDAYCELTGYDRGELLGEHISVVVDEETVEQGEALRERLFAGDGESGSVEVEIERADGERVAVESRYAPMPGDTGGTVGVVRDVSERRAFEETLTALHEASRDLYAAESEDDVARVVLRTLTDVLGLDAATLFRLDDEAGVLRPVHQTGAAIDSGMELPTFPAGEESLTGHVLETGQFHAFDDIRETPYLADPQTDMRAGLIAPIDDERVLVVSSPAVGAFDERTERLVELLAGSARAALERQERERELRESERRYRMLVDNFPNGAVALYDEACQYVAVGGQMYDRIDLSPEDAVGMTVGERLSGEIAETLESVIQRAFEGSSEEAEAPYDGRDFRLQSLPIRDDDGEVILAMVVTRDVTERQQAEEALAESERRFRTMMEQSPLSTQIFDPEGNALMANPAWEELWDASSEAMGEYNVLEDEQLAEKGVLPHLERAFEGEATEVPAVRYDPEEIGKEGRPRWVEAFVYPVFDDSGEIREVVLIHNDVTEQRAYERELEQYEAIVEAVDDGVYVLDDEFRFVEVNDAYCEMTGYDREELLGEHCSLVIDQAVSDESAARLEEIVAGEMTGSVIEADIHRADGTRLRAESRFTAIDVDGDGEPLKVGVVRDVSERKERERALEESERRLRTLIEHFPNGAVALVDQSLRYRTVGGSPMEIVNTTSEELEGAPLEEALPPELADVLVPRYEAALRGDPSEFEGEVDDRVYQFHIVPVRDDDGEVFAALGMSQDVTDRKEYERALEESEQRYRTLAEHFPHGAVGLYDHDLRYTLVEGQAWDDMEGVGPEDLKDEIASEALPPETAADVVPIFEAALRGETSSVESTLGGREFEVWATPVRDDDGEIFAGLSVAMDVTEQREYERALAESEQRYRTLVESYPDGAVAMFDSDLRYTVAGGQLLEAEGVDPEERIGKSIFEIYPEDLIEEVEPHFRAALEGEMNSFEVRYRGLDLFNHTLPVTDADGEVLGGMLVVNDVTEQREYERQLERFQTIIETVEDGVYTIDGDGYITMVNSAYAEMVGRHREELIGMHATELVDEDVADRAREIEEELVANESGTARLVADLKTADDRTVTAEATFALLPGDDDDYERVAVVRDITERIERERELERALGLLDRTGDIADVGGWEIDVETMEVYWSDQIFDLLGWPEGEIPPLEEALDVYHEDDRSDVGEAIEGALETGEPFDVEVRFLKDDEELRWARIWGVPEVDDGEVVTLRGAFQDITERVRREAELRERVEQEDVVTELGTLALEEPDLDRLFDRATDAVAETLDNDLCKLLELEPDGESLGLRAGVGWDDGLVGETALGSEDDSIAGRTLQTEKAIVVDDVMDEAPENRPALLTSHGGRSGVSVIVGTPRDPWGVLGTYDTDVKSFSRQDVNFVQSVANILGIAIERAEREEELHRRIEQQQVVTDLGRRALEEVDLDSLFEEAVERIAETLDNEFAKVLELQEDDESLLLRSGVGWRDGLVGEGTVGTGDDSQAGHTLRSDEPIVVDDLATESRFSGPELLRSHGVRSGLSTVIGPRDDPWGVLGTHDTTRREFSQQDVNFLQSVANILATAIDRRTREREIEEQRNRMAAIVRLSEIVQEVDQAVIRQSSREEIDRMVCAHLVESGEYEAAWVGDVNLASGTVTPRAVAGVDDDLVEPEAFDADGESAERSPTAVAAATGESGVARDGPDAAAFPAFARERGYRSMAAVPLAFEDVRYGVLTLFSAREDAFVGYERTILEQLGGTVGHAINAIDRKQALVGDSFTELEIRLPDVVAALDVPSTGEGEGHSITVDGTVPSEGGRVIQYVTVAGLDPETFHQAADQLPAVEAIRRIGGGDGPTHRYEVTYADPPVTSTLASYGGRIESIGFDVPDLRITVALPPTADVRQIVEALRSEFPDVTIDAQRTVTREPTSTEEYRDDLEDALTERQRTALMTAFFAGYFEWSRESTGEEVAETLGVSPSTFHQHLRAAQRKVLARLFEDD